MRFWWRELAGWLLIALGLYLFRICVNLVLGVGFDWPQFIQAGWMFLIGFVIFRGGIHLLKVAVAARACMHAQAEITRSQSAPIRRRARPAPWEE